MPKSTINKKLNYNSIYELPSEYTYKYKKYKKSGETREYEWIFGDNAFLCIRVNAHINQ